MTVVTKPKDDNDDKEGTALHLIKEGKVDLVINISEGTDRKDEITQGYVLRRGVVDFGVSLITDVKCAIKLAECFDLGMGDGKFVPRNVGEYYTKPTIGWTSKQIGASDM